MSAPVDKTCRSTQWFTPPRALDPIRHFFSLRPGSGVIDLDPATSLDNPVGANCWCVSRADAADPVPLRCFVNGLSHQWQSDATGEMGPDNVFVNPPFGGSLRDWTAKIAAEAECGARIVALLPGQRFETRYWQRMLRSPSLIAMVLVRRRLSFIEAATGKPKSGNTYGSLLYVFDRGPLAWGHAAQAFGHLGLVLRVGDRAGSDIPERGASEWSPPARGGDS